MLVCTRFGCRGIIGATFQQLNPSAQQHASDSAVPPRPTLRYSCKVHTVGMMTLTSSTECYAVNESCLKRSVAYCSMIHCARTRNSRPLSCGTAGIY